MTRYCSVIVLSCLVSLAGCKPASEAPPDKADAAPKKEEAEAPAKAAIPEDLDLVIPNGRVMDPESKLDAVRNVGVKDRMVERRAIEAAIWGMPIVNFQAMRDGLKRDAGVGYNDVAYNSKVQTWRLRTTTNNNTTPYIFIFWNVKNGPVVVDIPPSSKDVGLFGTLMDAWQRPLEDVGAKGKDQGRGAKYLIVPPGYQGPYPDGYITLPQQTFNGYTLMRPIIADASDENLKSAAAYVKTVKVYPFARADNPPKTKYIDIYDKDINGITEFDASFYERLNMMVQEEPIESKDLAMMGLLKAIGIEKGVAYAPDSKRMKILDAAGAEAHKYLLDQYVNGIIPPFYGKQKWSSAVPPGGIPSGLEWDFPGYLDVDGRGALYYAVYTSVKNLGAATFYLMTAKDESGQYLDGGKNYKLSLPKDVPARNFWSVIAYDSANATWFENQPKAGVASSDKGLKTNADGTIDIYFGPKAPAGQEANSVPTTPDTNYWLYFRFYGPEPAVFTKSWQLPDLEEVK